MRKIFFFSVFALSGEKTGFAVIALYGGAHNFEPLSGSSGNRLGLRKVVAKVVESSQTVAELAVVAVSSLTHGIL